MTRHVLYLHGFASSSQSEKALLVKQFFQQHLPEIQLHIPDLPYTPVEAWAEIQQLIERHSPSAVIGSSLGGFLATRVSEQCQIPAALINPAVAPHRLLANHLGRYYHPVRQQHYDVTDAHLPYLASLMVTPLTSPNLCFVLLQTGDEVLDYREAVQYYQGSTVDVQVGGDHSYQDLTSRLWDIVNFCQLA